MVETPRIVVISASVGAGHDGAAAELTRRLEILGFSIERHDFLDLLPRHLGKVLCGVYRRQLSVAPRSWGWLLAIEQQPWFTQRTAELTALADNATMEVLGARGSAPAAVVSTYPFASQVLGRLRRTGRLTAPAITYLTDMSVHPLWIAEGIDTHLAIHPVAAEAAKTLDAADVRVIAPAVRPEFTRTMTDRFDLPEGMPLALVVAGAWGVGSVEQTSHDIAATGLAMPVVACGRNEMLYRRVSRAGHAVPLGWVNDMATLMRTCDVVVQNAGGLSSLEALASGVPVVTYRCLPGHGQTNAEGLERSGWVPWIRSVDELGPTLRQVLTDPPPRIDVAAETPDDVIATIASLHSQRIVR